MLDDVDGFVANATLHPLFTTAPGDVGFLTDDVIEISTPLMGALSPGYHIIHRVFVRF